MTTEMEKPDILAAEEYLTIIRMILKKMSVQLSSHMLRSWKNLPDSRNSLLIILSVRNIDKQKINVIRSLPNKHKYFLLFKGDMPSKGVVDRLTWLDIRDENRIHMIDDADNNVKIYLERLLSAYECQGNDDHILDAWWEENNFVVVSPARDGFSKLRIPLDKLNVLKNKKRELLERFEIDEDGLFIYWPNLDVHLGWEQFEQAMDSNAYFKAKQQSEEFNQRYGKAIRLLRIQKGFRQSDVDGLTPRQVGRIEQGKCRATHAAIVKLARAHNLPVSDYLDELAKNLS